MLLNYSPNVNQSWFLSAAPAASPKIQNPWGGKSMGWEILGKSMDKSRIFGNSDFDKKSRFENKLVGLFSVFLSFVDEVPIQWH